MGAALDHANGGGPILLSRITGPAAQTGPHTFAVSLTRSASTTDRRNRDIWLLATHPGDDQFKSAVQQALLRVPVNTTGAVQQLTFPLVAEVSAGTPSLKLAATSDRKLPVAYYVREGPAEVVGDLLRFTPIPPRAKFPVEMTVVAWQWGRGTEPKIQAAEPVTARVRLIRRLQSMETNDARQSGQPEAR